MKINEKLLSEIYTTIQTVIAKLLKCILSSEGYELSKRGQAEFPYLVTRLAKDIYVKVFIEYENEGNNKYIEMYTKGWGLFKQTVTLVPVLRHLGALCDIKLNTDNLTDISEFYSGRDKKIKSRTRLKLHRLVAFILDSLWAGIHESSLENLSEDEKQLFCSSLYLARELNISEEKFLEIFISIVDKVKLENSDDPFIFGIYLLRSFRVYEPEDIEVIKNANNTDIDYLRRNGATDEDIFTYWNKPSILRELYKFENQELQKDFTRKYSKKVKSKIENDKRISRYIPIFGDIPKVSEIQQDDPLPFELVIPYREFELTYEFDYLYDKLPEYTSFNHMFRNYLKTRKI